MHSPKLLSEIEKWEIRKLAFLISLKREMEVAPSEEPSYNSFASELNKNVGVHQRSRSGSSIHRQHTSHKK